MREGELKPMVPSGRRGVKKAWTAALAGGVLAEGEGRYSRPSGEDAMGGFGEYK